MCHYNAYTFASYAISGFSFADSEWARKAVAGLIILIFTLVNIWSVKGMGKIEDIMKKYRISKDVEQALTATN